MNVILCTRSSQVSTNEHTTIRNGSSPQAVRRTIRPAGLHLPWFPFLVGTGITALGFAAYE